MALDVPAPPPKGSVEGDNYCFDKNIKFFSEKAETTRFADFYKEGCFLIEAKQGSTNSAKGHGKRGTKGYRDAMQQAFNQAKSYAYNRMLPALPPFLITCDIGSHFEVWEGFSGEYGSYGARQQVNLKDLAQAEVFDRFVAIFTDPQSLNPEKYRARVTREVAAELAKLSRWLEDNARSDESMVGVRLKPPLVVQSPPTRTKTSLASPDPKSAVSTRRAANAEHISQSAQADFATRASISIEGGIDGGTKGGAVSPHEVANFLMRCIFTMFAEDAELLKGLEQEAIARLVDVAGEVQLGLEQINPAQFLGIEINPRAAAIAELVIWIGYLQWYFKRYGNAAPPEPVLQAFGNIECRDAVLAYDGTEPDLDAKTGEVRSRWGGRMIKHPVTGEDVPDASDRVVIYKYLNPRAAEWPKADYIVSNPPFIGNARMREILGDGYTEITRKIYKDVPDTVDYVMYWWYKAANLISKGIVEKFGFITTNSISQPRLRSLVQSFLESKKPLRLTFAIANHPWIDDGADVRIAMTASESDTSNSLLKTAKLGVVVSEAIGETPEETAEKIIVEWHSVGKIFADLRSGIDITSAIPLIAQSELACNGVEPYGAGFTLDFEKFSAFSEKSREIIHPYRNGRDITQKNRNVFVIDCFGMTEANLQDEYPEVYQHLLENIYPERCVERDANMQKNWWLFNRNRPDLRKAIKNTRRYIVTVKAAKHRTFIFIEKSILPDVKLTVIALDDSYYLGILSSSTHVGWAISSGGRLGVGNDPVYVKTKSFDAFPFPDSTPEQKQKIRELGDRLDTHRKQVQAVHPDITITGMYNLLEKLRAGTAFSELDRAYNNRALVSTLNQIHDELDKAVFEAYGWQDLSGKPTAEIDETILERLVALNAERAAEERNGHIRWLRPEYQAPTQIQSTQIALPGIDVEPETVITPIEQQKWPTLPKAQLAAIRDLLRTSSGEWTVAQIANQFTGKNTQKKLAAIGENLDQLQWFGVKIYAANL